MLKCGLDAETINKIIEIFKKYKEVECAKIFGSRARGTHRKSSDIDIALFGKDLTHTINTKIFFEIDNLYLPYKIDLINFNTLKLEDKLRVNILQEGVDIYVK